MNITAIVEVFPSGCNRALRELEAYSVINRAHHVNLPDLLLIEQCSLTPKLYKDTIGQTDNHRLATAQQMVADEQGGILIEDGKREQTYRVLITAKSFVPEFDVYDLFSQDVIKATHKRAREAIRYTFGLVVHTPAVIRYMRIDKNERFVLFNIV
jgi:hypothetical protein